MNYKAKRVAVSFSNKTEDQYLLKFLETKKKTVGISDYVKNRIRSDPDFIKIMNDPDYLNEEEEN